MFVGTAGSYLSEAPFGCYSKTYHGNFNTTFSRVDILWYICLPPWVNVIKLFNVVIYCCSMVITKVILFDNTEWKHYHGVAVKYHGEKFVKLTPGPNVIRLFTMVIYCHSMVIPSFCVIKLHYLSNYCRRAVICHRNIYNIEFTLKWQ